MAMFQYLEFATLFNIIAMEMSSWSGRRSSGVQTTLAAV